MIKNSKQHKETSNLTIDEILAINRSIYQLPDDRLYDLDDMFYYHQKWLLRYTGDKKQLRIDSATKNLIISLAWYFALINRFDIDLTKSLGKRYSFKCPFCLELPCCCDQKVSRPQKTGRPVSGLPKNLDGWQHMISKIYPVNGFEFKNLEILRKQDAFHQSFRKFRRTSGKKNLDEIGTRSADYFVEILKAANRMKINLSTEYLRLFEKGCFACGKSPCQCKYYE